MTTAKQSASALRALLTAAAIAASGFLTGCANMYVDTATKEVPVSAMKKPAQLKPTAINFEFQTKGEPNARATAALKDSVNAQAAQTGLFGPATDTGSAMLTIALNNIPLTDDAAAKGFATGLTFGLAGTAVTDGYVCTVSYLPAGQTTPIVKTARHAIHTTLGNASPPPGAGAPVDADTAVRTMTRAVISTALRDLSLDPSFN
ncbi:MAG TPA: hypothetical protein VGC21_06415 [Telluria sp.]|jgi:hypothetical protein